MTGTVYLVGAGPGDPGLITVKGLDVLRRADVILYDRLIAPELLHEARTDVELIDVGKVSFRPQQKITQEQINQLLIEKAQTTAIVVRLKGGDPFVFGRGGEEALACRAAGVPFIVIPGVSSAIAVPAYAGIPITQRGMVTAFTVFAGHEDPTKPGSTTDFEALARAARMGTLVLLMGVVNMPILVEKLVAAGLDPQMPAACIEWGTTAQQRSVCGTVDTLPELIKTAAIKPPATTVIGQVVALHEALGWFSEFPKQP
jgi:uroporphyrinogen III methyltransferase/synthase